MAPADLGTAAAAMAAVWALVEGFRAVGQLRWPLLAASVLLPVNLVLAWHVEDTPGTTVEGMAAAVGLLLAVALFATALIAGATARFLRWAVWT